MIEPSRERGRHGRRRSLAALATAAVVGIVVASATGATGAAQDDKPSGAATARAGAFKKARLDSQLAEVSAVAASRGDAAATARGKALGVPAAGDRVRVVVESTDVAAAQTSVLAGGGNVEATYANLVRGLVQPSSLTRISQTAGVKYVRAPMRPHADSMADEGVDSTNASAWQTLGRTGVGVKVGIVDLGFADYTTGQASGDLPGSLTTVDFCAGGFTTGTEHGTAVAEIVHKMAPAAQLYLICVADEVSLGQAEEYAKANGITVINHSVGWFDSSRGDGSGGPGTPDAIVADARANGILWVNSAGNYADTHWSGSFNDSDGDGYHNFTGTDEGQSIFVFAGDTMCATLKWDNWPASSQDYDLYMFTSSTGDVVADSTNLQNGTQAPTEDFCYTNDTGLSQFFFLAIYKFAAATKPRFDMFVFGATTPLQYQTPSGSLSEPATSPNVLAVGAICWQNNALEQYSSRGPTIDNRVKPDIAGPDSTSSPVYGSFAVCGATGFSGTSAASPHVAGAAALVKSLHPTWTPTEIQNLLVANAADLGPGGKDNSFGAGRVRLPVVAPKVGGFSPPSGPVGTTVTLTGSALLGATAVNFNGAPAAPTSIAATSLKAVVPPGATSGPVQVVTPDGVGTSTAVFKVTPKVIGLSPGLGVRGSSVQISGTSFTGASRVAFGAVASASFTVDDDSTIHAVVPATATTNKVTVTTPGGAGASATNFVVTLPPTVSGFSPPAAPVGSLLTVNGSSLDSVTSATLNGQDVGTLTHVSATQLRLTVPAAASTGKIAVTNDAGTGQSGALFKVTPKITGFSPGLGVRGSSVQISGTSFTGASRVAFGAVASASFTVDDDSTIHAVVPATATTNKVTVTTPGGAGASATNFVVTLPPTVSGFSPPAAPVGSLLTVNGSSLDSVTSATLNGQDVGTLTHVSATQLRLTVPAAASTGKIAVTNDAGTGQSGALFKVTPKITGFSPGLGVRGSSVQISGTSFTGASRVAFGAVASASFTVDDDSTIHAVVPATATTNKVTVTTPGGAGASATNFVVTLPPTVSGFSPPAAPVGSLLTVNGSSLDSVTSATLNGQDVGTLTHVSATQLRLTVPAAASTGKIAVTNDAGTGQSGALFKVTPKITGYTPSAGAPGGAAVTINGTSLTGTTLKFNGLVAAVEAGSDDTHIETHVPATATTGVVSVTTPGGTVNGPAFKVLPTIASLTPDNGAAGTSVAITGTTFVGGSSVKFNGVAAAASVMNATTIKATVPAGATTGPVTVTTPGGTATSPTPFTVGPKVTSFAPASGPTGATVTITGNGFHGTPTVSFNSLPSPSVTNVTATSLKAVVPNGATTGQIQVTTSDGPATSTANFTVTFNITGFTPSSGPAGTTVTITGIGFLKATDVKLGNFELGGTVDSDTQMTTTVSPGATSGPLVIGNGTVSVRAPTDFVVASFARSAAGQPDDLHRSEVTPLRLLSVDSEAKALATEERLHGLPEDAEVVAEQRRAR